MRLRSKVADVATTGVNGSAVGSTTIDFGEAVELDAVRLRFHNQPATVGVNIGPDPSIVLVTTNNTDRTVYPMVPTLTGAGYPSGSAFTSPMLHGNVTVATTGGSAASPAVTVEFFYWYE